MTNQNRALPPTTNEITPEQERLINLFFWSVLPRSEHPDRRDTGGGDKTKTGLVRVCERIARAGQQPTAAEEVQA